MIFSANHLLYQSLFGAISDALRKRTDKESWKNLPACYRFSAGVKPPAVTDSHESWWICQESWTKGPPSRTGQICPSNWSFWMEEEERKRRVSLARAKCGSSQRTPPYVIPGFVLLCDSRIFSEQRPWYWQSHDFEVFGNRVKIFIFWCETNDFAALTEIYSVDTF